MLLMHAATAQERTEMHTLSVLWGTDVCESTLRPGFIWKTGNFDTLQTVALQNRHVRDRNFPLRRKAILSEYMAKHLFDQSVLLPDEMNQPVTFIYQWVAPAGFDPLKFNVEAKVRKLRSDYMEFVESRQQSISTHSRATDNDDTSEPTILPNQLLPYPSGGLPGRPRRLKRFRGSMAERDDIDSDSGNESCEEELVNDDDDDYEIESEEDEDNED
jgi:hypothetical protein